jgi:hypothetical protein
VLRNLTSHNTSSSTSSKSRDKVPFGDVPASQGVESLSEWLIQPCDGGGTMNSLPMNAVVCMLTDLEYSSEGPSGSISTLQLFHSLQLDKIVGTHGIGIRRCQAALDTTHTLSTKGFPYCIKCVQVDLLISIAIAGEFSLELQASLCNLCRIRHSSLGKLVSVCVMMQREIVEKNAYIPLHRRRGRHRQRYPRMDELLLCCWTFSSTLRGFGIHDKLKK